MKDKYDNSAVRRQDRLLDEKRAAELLDTAEYGFLAIGGGNGGYGIPLNFVFDGEHIYFHCAPEGEKLQRIAQNPAVGFCVVGMTEPLAGKFTTLYESVMVSGQAALVTDAAERMEALVKLLEKYSPEYLDTGRKYAEKSFPRTAILRLDIESISGKCKK